MLIYCSFQLSSLPVQQTQMPQSPFNPWLPVWDCLFCSHFLGQSLGQCWLISYPHCCRMPNSISSALQSQPVLAAGSSEWQLCILGSPSVQIPDWSQTSNLSQIRLLLLTFCTVGNHKHRTEKELKTSLPLPNRTTPGCHTATTHTEDTSWRQELCGVDKKMHKFMPYTLNKSLSASVPEAEGNCVGEQREAGCHPSRRDQELKMALYLWLQLWFESYQFACNLCSLASLLGTLLGATGQMQTCGQVPVLQSFPTFVIMLPEWEHLVEGRYISFPLKLQNVTGELWQFWEEGPQQSRVTLQEQFLCNSVQGLKNCTPV